MDRGVGLEGTQAWGLTRRMSTGSVVAPHRCRAEAERANGLGVGRGGDMFLHGEVHQERLPSATPISTGWRRWWNGWRV